MNNTATAWNLHRLTGGAVQHSTENGRDFVSITRKLENDDKASNWLKTAIAAMRKDGWQVTAFSNGTRHTPGFHLQCGIDAMRGEGPRTAYEKHMIATCTGND
jgi:hypothetical protein